MIKDSLFTTELRLPAGRQGLQVAGYGVQMTSDALDCSGTPSGFHLSVIKNYRIWVLIYLLAYYIFFASSALRFVFVRIGFKNI